MTTAAGNLAALVEIVGENMTTLDPVSGLSRKISVEIALPTYPSVLGEMILGTGLLSGISWYPVTGKWTGATIDRGSDDGSAAVGTMELTLRDDAGELTPWSTIFPQDGRSFAAPGTLVRISHELAGDALPIMTAVVESWTVRRSLAGDREIFITAVETTALLASINDTALTSPVGSGDTTPERISRLLTAARWPYGADLAAATAATHQSTVMAQDRLSELYLTATSGGRTFRANRLGQAMLAPELLTASPIVADEAAFITDKTLDIANDADLIVNALTLATAGGTETLYENTTSIGRHGRRTGGRNDLNLTIGSSLATLAADELARGSATIRPRSFDFEADRAPAIAHTIDIGTEVELTTVDGVTFAAFRVAGLHHELAPMGATGLAWTVSVSLSPSSSWTVTLPALVDLLTTIAGDGITTLAGDPLTTL